MSRVCVLMSLVASVALAACSDKTEKTEKTEKSPEEKAAEEKAARTKVIASEADMNLTKIFAGSIAYYQKDFVARGVTAMIDKQFPVSAEAPSDWKAKVCPEKGKPAKKYVPDGDTWSADTWQRLDFAIADPFYNRYVYVTEGTFARSKGSIKAISDPNCDGNEVVVELKFKVNGENEVVQVQ